MPTIGLTDDEHAAVTALLRRALEQDRFSRAPRLDPLRSALAKLDPAAADDALRRPLAAKKRQAAPQQLTTLKGRPRGACRMQGQRRHR
jgi:hypothetical protein